MDKRWVNDIENVEEVLESRGRLGGTTVLASRMATQLACASLDAGSAAKLTEAVGNSAYVQDGKHMISRATEEKLISGGGDLTVIKKGVAHALREGRCSGVWYDEHCNKRCKNFFTAQECDILNSDRVSKRSKFQVIVDQLLRSGLHNPNEITFGYGLAILLCTLAAAQTDL